MRKYHRENCDCFLREIVIDIWNRKVVLSGQHAFEWSITIYTKEKIVKTVYPNGSMARREFRRYKKRK